MEMDTCVHKLVGGKKIKGSKDAPCLGAVYMSRRKMERVPTKFTYFLNNLLLSQDKFLKKKKNVNVPH